MKNNVLKVTKPAMSRIKACGTKAAVGAMAFLYSFNCAYADEPSTIEGTADKFINNLVGIIALFGKYIGACLGAWGVIQLALAFKNEDADSKSRALMLIIAAIILFNVQMLIDMLQLNVSGQ